VKGGAPSRTQDVPPFDVRKIVASPLWPPPTAVQIDALEHEMSANSVGPAAKSRVCHVPDAVEPPRDADAAARAVNVASGAATPAIRATAATQALSDGCIESPKIADNDGPY